MREFVLALSCLVLVAGLVGCIGSEEAEVDPEGETGSIGSEEAEVDPSSNTTADDLNPWQEGLDENYPTPDVAEHHSREDRRSNVAPPGDPEFAAFDATVDAWMDHHNISTGTLAVMKDGQLRYERGFGYTDREETQPANASTMMRIASVTKAMSERVISMMVEEGRFAWGDPVFCVPPDPKPDCLLPLDPHPSRPVVDDRIANITVEHLRNHTAGWSEVCSEPIWDDSAVELARTMGVDSPAPAWRTVQWLMGAELARDPGEASEYCNTGYITLGAVAEAVTGATFEAVLDAYLFRPLDVEGDIEAGRALPEERNPREPFYACDGEPKQSVFDPNETVCAPDGSWSLTATLAAGGLTSTPAAAGAVLDSITPLEFSGAFTSIGLFHGSDGSVPGTKARVQLINTTETGKALYAYVFNSRTLWEGCDSPLGVAPGCGWGDLNEALTRELRAWSTAHHQTPGNDVPASAR